MTFDEAVAKCKQIEPYTLGLPLKARRLIAPPTGIACAIT